ncbi:cell division protein FtsK [Gallibacterium genomosp. 1]|uniref:DNA translocase FtsK n=1 Tax=Gallibacterium genomosp. 1 TaxID=155515 RepID=A0AB36DWV5_9PAST|nr:cell division protein FtsK [Gallibacterium genomosp. 1]OBX02673.1 cell division protein FtsK [Gallibacterium genomosp. 1]
MKKEYLRSNLYLFNLGLILLTFFGLYLLVAWASYHPMDNAWTIASNQPTVYNKAGAFGAWIIDVLFALFGRIANILPFICFLVPIFLLRYHPITEMKWRTFFLHCIGFLLFLCSISTLAALYLPNSSNHLAGGVIGTIIVQFIAKTTGTLLLSLIALLTTALGFVLSAGNDFLKVLLRFYHWLMATDEQQKIEDTSDTVQTEKSLADYEQIVLPISPNRREKQENGETPSPYFQPQDEKQLVNPTIFGLTPQENIPTTEVETATSFEQQAWQNSLETAQAQAQEDSIANFDFPMMDIEEQPELPKVSISMPSPMESATLNNVAPTPEITAASTPKQETSLSPMNISPISSIQDEDDYENDDEELAHLREEFLAQQKMKEQQYAPPKTETESSTPATPNYKPYNGTLIHPLLQPDPISTIKPTTPLPSLDLLNPGQPLKTEVTQAEIQETSRRIEQQLRNFGVKAAVRNVTIGPVVTRYEIELQPGTKASKVTSIDTDLARALMFRSIRIAEVIPGKPYIGIETPNMHRQNVLLRDVLSSAEFQQAKSPLSMVLGKDISGKAVVVDLAKMPHLLVAGATGSGKSVGVNAMILSLLFKVQPEEVKFIMIDPKQVELSMYNDIPHLLTNVVTDMNKAANALRWCVDEMERRYQLLTALHVRNIEGFNHKIDQATEMQLPIPNPIWKPGDTMDEMPPALEKLPYIVVIVDEFADLMMIVGKQVEELIARLAQKARAIGIHLILATQRPSVDVITGLIKANIPSRIAFTVASKIDSRTILDQSGAEALLGKGDMLYSGQGDLIRVHGAYMTDDEVARIANDWRARGKPNYLDEIVENNEEEQNNNGEGGNNELDEKFDEAVNVVLSTGNTSASFLQRRLGLGFPRAARILDQMEQQGILSSLVNGKREILAPRNNY